MERQENSPDRAQYMFCKIHIGGSVQDCSISIANALELLLSRTPVRARQAPGV